MFDEEAAEDEEAQSGVIPSVARRYPVRETRGNPPTTAYDKFLKRGATAKKVNFRLSGLPPEPTTVKEALAGTEALQWMEAMEKERFLKMLGEVAASQGMISQSAFVRSAYREISCALVRGNGLMYGRSLFNAARASGRSFLPGCDVPVQDEGLV